MSDHHLTVEVFVNGVGVAVEANPNAALTALIEEALRKSQNSGQPPDAWELKDAAGNAIDRQAKYRDLPPGIRLYLSPRAGVGGRE